MTRALRASFLTMAAVVGICLATALGLGAPHPGLIERGAAAAFGLLGLGAGSITLSDAVEAGLPVPPKRVRDGEEPIDAGTASQLDLERSLRIGAAAAGDFYAHLRPRLVPLAKSRLSRQGVALSDRERSTELLGPEGYALVDPGAAPPTDRFGPGVRLEEVRKLLDRLEALGGGA